MVSGNDARINAIFSSILTNRAWSLGGDTYTSADKYNRLFSTLFCNISISNSVFHTTGTYLRGIVHTQASSIEIKDSSFFLGGYSVFGTVTEGDMAIYHCNFQSGWHGNDTCSLEVNNSALRTSFSSFNLRLCFLTSTKDKIINRQIQFYTWNTTFESADVVYVSSERNNHSQKVTLHREILLSYPDLVQIEEESPFASGNSRVLHQIFKIEPVMGDCSSGQGQVVADRAARSERFSHQCSIKQVYNWSFHFITPLLYHVIHVLCILYTLIFSHEICLKHVFNISITKKSVCSLYL